MGSVDTSRIPRSGTERARVLRPGLDLDAFFGSVARHPGRPLLLLDYDGTLAPFQKQRDRAFPYPGVVEALTALQRNGRTRLVLVTGRSLQDLDRLLPLDPPPEIWGSHGWERRLADGEYSIAELGAEARRGLDAAHAAAREARASEHCERKPAGLALHWRGVDRETVGRYRDRTLGRWTEIAEEHGLELHPFDGGVEIRSPGRDKGFAVRTLLAEMGEATPAAYLGDDVTDEDGFAAVGGAGIGVLVRPRYRATHADAWLRPPEELLDFFDRWRAADRAGNQPW